MKKIITVLVSLAAALSLQAQGNLTYSLPRTTLELEVEAVRTTCHAGPYAAYAPKYLGMEAPVRDTVAYRISQLRLTSRVEADPSERYSYAATSAAGEKLLQLTSQGLVAGEPGAFSAETGWKFPSSGEESFSYRPANLTSRLSTLYDPSTGQAVTQRVVVEKGEEAKAAETADRIFEIRQNKYKILVGDTDATYSGEAMKAAIDALDAMEKQLMTLFLGTVTEEAQKSVFEVIPNAANKTQTYVAFRISPEEGLVGADNFSGIPYYLQISAEQVKRPAPAESASKKAPLQTIRYKVPLICLITVGDGVNPLIRHRVPVYQFGSTEEYPIYK